MYINLCFCNVNQASICFCYQWNYLYWYQGLPYREKLKECIRKSG